MIVPDLTSLGLFPGIVCESIITTYGKSGRPAAAPMGVMASVDEPTRLVVRPFPSTKTCLNLHLRKCAVINITHEPEIFFRTTFRETNERSRVPPDWFFPAKTVDAPRLQPAEAFIEVDAVEMESQDDRALFLCGVRLVEAIPSSPRVFCRAQSAIIESIIHATRIKNYLEKKETAQVEELLNLTIHYQKLVERLGPNSRYEILMSQLTDLMKTWGAKL